QSLRDRGRLIRVSLEARAARARRGQRLLRRRHQPRRIRSAVEHRRVLRTELLLRPARSVPGAGQTRRRRAGDRGARPGEDPRSAAYVAVLQGPAAGDVYGFSETLILRSEATKDLSLHRQRLWSCALPV